MDKFYRKQFHIQGKRVIDGDNPDNERRAYYAGIISSDDLDTHFSRMSESTLQNFAEDAENGVTVLDSHRHYTAGIGRTAAGKYEEGKVYSDFYLVRDVPLGDSQSYSNTNGFITMLDDGALRDISVGFYGGTEVCDICNEAIWESLQCRHWPGSEYIIIDEETEEKTVVTCTTTIVDARLSEISLVYDGSNEDSEITEKANRLAEQGEINTKQKLHIENRFNVRFKQGIKFPDPDNQEEINELKNKQPDKTRVSDKGDNPMAKTVEELQTEVEELESQVESLRSNVATWKEKGERAGTLETANNDLTSKNEKLEKRQSDDADTIERLTQEKRDLKVEVDKIKPMADEGERYRKEEETLAYTEFVRMKGDELNEENKDSERAKNTLSNLLTIEDVRDMRKIWAENADIKYPAGRKTSDTGDTGTDPDPDPESADENGTVVPGADAY